MGCNALHQLGVRNSCRLAWCCLTANEAVRGDTTATEEDHMLFRVVAISLATE